MIFNSQTSRRVAGSAWLERRDRARVVPNGVAGPSAPTPARIRLDAPLRIVYVGRLSPRKGVDLVVDAVARLQGLGLAAELEIVGDVFPGYEWYEQSLRDRVSELAIGERVRFAGFQRSVWDRLSAADVAVLPLIAACARACVCEHAVDMLCTMWGPPEAPEDRWNC